MLSVESLCGAEILRVGFASAFRKLPVEHATKMVIIHLYSLLI